MSKTHSITVRFAEHELARLLALPRHPADRSESDRIRRMLAERAEQIEQEVALAALPSPANARSL
jgi:hypothetical protein